MKDKAWLREEVKSLFDEAYDSGKMEYHESEESIYRINSLVDQLDEPETLSQEWIDENKVARINDVRKMTTSDVVIVEKLENLLVPKQDNGFVVFEKDKLDKEVQRMIDETCKETSEKPVIPQFVADWIDAHNLHGNNPLREYRDLEIDFNEGWTNEEDAEVYHWINKNPYAFIDVLRYGYEVEKEPQWVVRYEDGYFSEEIKFGCGIDGDWVDEVSRAYHFTDKAKAEAVALLIGGTVEEVTE